jgi:MFS superfamily sulfate permease-like transporter
MLLVIFSESLGAAQNFATKHGYEVDPNQELIALGVANAGSGFVGGLAAGGSLSQSAVNEGAGARSEASALVAALLMVVTVLVLTPVFTNLPEAVLAALIIQLSRISGRSTRSGATTPSGASSSCSPSPRCWG